MLENELDVALVAPMVHSDDSLVDAAEPRAIWMTPPDVITPELVLVSRELAEEARRRLPHRPWELALRRAGVSLASTARGEVPRGQAASRLTEAAASPVPLVGYAVAARSDLFDDELDDRRRPWRTASVLMLAAAIAIALLAGPPDLDRWKGGSGDNVLTTTPRPDPFSDTPVDTRPPLLPTAGYVVSPGGSLLTDASGRRIASFTLPLRCGDARQLVIRDIPLSGRSLRVTARVVGRAITVRLTGRILRRHRFRGVVAAEGRACSADPVAFVARLS